MAAEELIAALALRTRGERERLTAPGGNLSSEYLQIAQMSEDKKNRDFLRKDALQRRDAADAARVMGILQAEKNSAMKKGSYDYGMKVGLEDPSVGDMGPPEDYDPDYLNKGLTAGRLLKGAKDKGAATAAKAAMDKEKRALLDKLAADLSETGGDPRPLLANPSKLAGMDPTKIISMKRLAMLLDKEEAGGEEDAGLREFDSLLGGLDDVDAILNAPLPAGVDPTKADAIRNRRANTLLRKGAQDLTAKRLDLMKEKWAAEDARRERDWAQGLKDKVLSEMGREIDDLAQQIRLGRTEYGQPKNPNADAVLSARYAQLMQAREKMAGGGVPRGTPAPGGPAPDSKGMYQWIGGESGTDIVFTDTPTAPRGFKPYTPGGGGAVNPKDARKRELHEKVKAGTSTEAEEAELESLIKRK